MRPARHRRRGSTGKKQARVAQVGVEHLARDAGWITRPYPLPWTSRMAFMSLKSSEMATGRRVHSAPRARGVPVQREMTGTRWAAQMRTILLHLLRVERGQMTGIGRLVCEPCGGNARAVRAAPVRSRACRRSGCRNTPTAVADPVLVACQVVNTQWRLVPPAASLAALSPRTAAARKSPDCGAAPLASPGDPVSDAPARGRNTHDETHAIVATVILQGGISAASLVVEIVAGRMLAPHVGMSLYTWTAVIAVVLAGFSCRPLGGGDGWPPCPRNPRAGPGPAARSSAAAATTAAAVLILPMGGWAGSGRESTSPVWGITALTMVVFFLPSFFAGVPAPVLAQIAITAHAPDPLGPGAWRDVRPRARSGPSRGVLLAGFVSSPWLGSALTPGAGHLRLHLLRPPVLLARPLAAASRWRSLAGDAAGGQWRGWPSPPPRNASARRIISACGSMTCRPIPSSPRRT